MKIRKPVSYLLLLVPLFLVAGCDRGDNSPDDEAGFEEATEEDELAYLSAQERAAYDLAVAQLEPALGADIDGVQLLSIFDTEWSDSSLGCAQPGVDYTQVVTTGYSLRIGGKGRTYVVNVAGDQAIVCNQPGAGMVSRPRASIHANQIASVRDRAIADLADKLGVDPSLIQASQLIPATWTNSALGCPESGVDYGDKEVSGFQMFLGYQDRAYTYNTDGEKVIACPPISND